MKPRIASVLAVAAACFLRVASRRRYWFGVGGMAAFVAFGAVEASTISGADGRPLGVAVGIFSAVCGMSLFPLVLPLIAGDLLASDVATDYVWLLRTRGAGRQELVWGHVVGHAAVAAVAGGIVAAAAVLTGFVVLPKGPATDPVAAVPFEAELFASSPALYLVLVTGLYVLAAVALLTASTCVGAWSANRLLASIGTPLAVLAAGIFMPGPLQAVNPLEQCMFANTWGASWVTPENVAGYWTAVGALCVLAALVGLQRRENAR